MKACFASAFVSTLEEKHEEFRKFRPSQVQQDLSLVTELLGRHTAVARRTGTGPRWDQMARNGANVSAFLVSTSTGPAAPLSR